MRRVCGIDVGFEDNGRITRAAVAVLAFPSLEPLEDAVARRPTSFPYVPGLLSFREIPAVLEALALLKTRPDLLLCDGQGIAHPRRCGLASHTGLATGLPSIGVTTSHAAELLLAMTTAVGKWCASSLAKLGPLRNVRCSRACAGC